MISVITAISVLGVAAGVMALVIALAVNNGFHNTLQRNLLGAMAHINVMEKEPLYGIENWRDMAARLRKLPHVTAVSPALYSPVYLAGPLQSKGAVLKGMDVDSELAISDSLRHLKSGIARPSARPERPPARHRARLEPGGRHRHDTEFEYRSGQPAGRADPLRTARQQPDLPRLRNLRNRLLRDRR